VEGGKGHHKEKRAQKKKRQKEKLTSDKGEKKKRISGDSIPGSGELSVERRKKEGRQTRKKSNPTTVTREKN